MQSSHCHGPCLLGGVSSGAGACLLSCGLQLGHVVELVKLIIWQVSHVQLEVEVFSPLRLSHILHLHLSLWLSVLQVSHLHDCGSCLLVVVVCCCGGGSLPGNALGSDVRIAGGWHLWHCCLLMKLSSGQFSHCHSPWGPSFLCCVVVSVGVGGVLL